MENEVLDYVIADFDERIKTLEEKLFRKKSKLEFTRAQKMLILKESGMLNCIDQLGMETMKKAKFISSFWGLDYDNVYKDLAYINRNKSALTTINNFEVLRDFFSQVGLDKLAEKADNEIDLINRSDKQK